MASGDSFDVIIVGGGLSGALVAWCLKQQSVSLSIALIEGGPRLGGNHTWCFFETDLSPEQRRFVAPLVVKHWPRYSVRFPGFSRNVETGYAAITSDRFHDVIAAELGSAVLTDTKVQNVAIDSVTLANGQRLRSACVLDARGVRETPHLALGFQKFIALELELATPHALSDPIIMDAMVPQDDGYRFAYILPFTQNRVLVYDTYYSDGRTLPVAKLRERILVYAAAEGWQVTSIVREEMGVLPIILAGDLQGLEAEQTLGAPKLGLAAAFFHPTTGYSLPDSVRVADRLAETARRGPLTTETARQAIMAYGHDIWQQRSYFRLLNRMLFQAGASTNRYKILERFYGLNTALIQRFYAADLNLVDRLRIIMGRPPVPIFSALACISEPATLRRWGNRTWTDDAKLS